MAPDLLRLEGTDQVSSLDLGGASNTARYRAIATPGSTIVACLARRARDLERPSTLVLREVPLPTRAPGEVKVALHARGVSSVDVLMIAGQYQVKRELPVKDAEVIGFTIGRPRP